MFMAGTELSNNDLLVPGWVYILLQDRSFKLPNELHFEELAYKEESYEDKYHLYFQISSAVHTNRSQNQWIELGYHSDVCLTHRYGCGEAGGALSMWLRLIDCPARSGIITSRAGRSVSPTGFNIACINPLRLQ